MIPSVRMRLPQSWVICRWRWPQPQPRSPPPAPHISGSCSGSASSGCRRQAWPRRMDGAQLVDHIDALTGSGLPEHTDHELRARILSARRWAVAQLTAAADFTRAIELGRRTLTDHEQLLGPDHPDTLVSRNNLANAYGSAGRLAEAITLHEQNLADRERVRGPDHPDTAASRESLARSRNLQTSMTDGGEHQRRRSVAPAGPSDHGGTVTPCPRRRRPAKFCPRQQDVVPRRSRSAAMNGSTSTVVLHRTTRRR
ncbi:tetratricopeptide repeat protein [Nocardia abscessus]|uniref:tetratricopeptide repeat protein n=2 Tax=Nocardia abscessus TaxID=120957 RepID=UPI0009FC180B|nr:tetratricopeptide repeat protein [Nocardia abscessus]